MSCYIILDFLIGYPIIPLTFPLMEALTLYLHYFYVLRWLGTVLQYPCKFVVFLLSFNIIMQYDDLKYVNVDNKIEVLTTWEFKSCNFKQFFLIRLFEISMEQNSQNFVHM